MFLLLYMLFFPEGSGGSEHMSILYILTRRGGSWGTGSDQYDFEQQAIDLSENDDMEERTNYFVEDNTDPIINQIIILLMKMHFCN